jgi:hypothetical protein
MEGCIENKEDEEKEKLTTQYSTEFLTILVDANGTTLKKNVTPFT